MDQPTLDKLNAAQKMAEEWLQNYKNANFEQTRPDLKQEALEMQLVLTKITKILAASSAEKAATPEKDWQAALQALESMVKGNLLYAACFGNVAGNSTLDALEIDVNQLKLAAELKRLSEDWYGRFYDNNAIPIAAKTLVAALQDCAKKVLTASNKGNSANEEELVLRYFGASKGDSRKVAQLLDDLAPDYAGKINIERIEDKSEQDLRSHYNIIHLPTLIFKKKGKEFARHEGVISKSELASKLQTMLDGGIFSNSSNIVSLDNQRTISDRELFSLGEFVVLYFTAVWSGVAKKMGNAVQEEVLTLATKSSKTTTIKYQEVSIDGKTHIHKKFHVDKVPTILFLRDGQESGRHEGYMNPSTLKETMRRFLANGAVDNGASHEFDLLGIEYTESQANSDRVDSKIPDKLSGSVGQGAKNADLDVYAIQLLLAQNGLSIAADGQCGSQLIALIKEYQLRIKQEPTGVIVPGDETWDALKG